MSDSPGAGLLTYSKHMPRGGATHVDDPAAVGRRLKQAREDAGLSQRKLAFPGCSSAYISRIESGERVPSLQLLRELAARLGVTVEFLAGGAGGSQSVLLDAELALRLDEVEEAERLFGAVLEQTPLPSEREAARVGLARVALRRSDYRAAIELFEQALRAAPGLDTPSTGEALGRAYAMVGEGEAARVVFERHLARARSVDDASNVVRFSVLLANALIDEGSYREAGEAIGDALQRAEGLSDPLARARLFWSQSRLHAMQENSEAATRYARKALEIVELTDDRYYLARAHHLLAFVETDAGRPESALELIAKGEELLGASGNDHERAQFQLERARALARLGRAAEAAELAMATAGAMRAGHPVDVGRSYATLAGEFEALGDAERACELFELAVEFLEDGPPRYLAEACSRLARLHEHAGRTEEALRLYRRVADLHIETTETAGR